MSLVSVIIPTFNRPYFLCEALESVINQTYKSIEIIVVDDGSENRGQKTLKALKPYISQLTYVYQKNQGIGAAVNKGLSMAKGEFIQRLDDDDRLEKEKIEKCVEVFKENPNVGLVATGYHVIDEEGNRIRTQMARSYPKNAGLLFMLMACISAQVAVMVKRECHDVVGFYRTDIMGEDYEMWLRIAKKYEVATINEPLAFYRRHKENITKLENLEKLERETVQFVRSYLNETPLEELIPNIRSKPYGYALKAAVYLLKDGIYTKTVHLAREELEKALTLAPNDPLLLLWELVLAVHGDDSSLKKENKGVGSFFAEGQQRKVSDVSSDNTACAVTAKEKELAKALLKLKEELILLKAKSLPPSSPEMTDFRRRFGLCRGELIRKTYKRAIS